MISLDTVYSNITGAGLNTQAKNATGAGLTNGTEFIAAGLNNGPEFGFMQSMMDYATGEPNAPTGAVGVPNNVSEGIGVSQIIEAMQRGFAIGPGKYVQWGLFDDPSVTLDRVLLLSNQGVLIATYPDLVTETYVGDGNNATAPFFYKAELADGLTRNIAGPFFILPPSRDYLFPNGPRETKARWHTISGQGSSSTRIQKFVSEVEQSDDIVVTVVNSPTLGFVVTANMNCEIYITYTTATSQVDSSFGLSLNSTQLTTSISLITSIDILCIDTDGPANAGGSVSWSGSILKDDVVRPHKASDTDGSSPQLGSITVFAKESPRKNSATVQGITY